MADSNNAAAAAGQGAPDSGQATESAEVRAEKYEQFFEQLKPLLTKLDENPEIIRALEENKLTKEIAQAAIDGKLSIQEAAQAAAATQAVVEEVGKKTAETMTPEALAKLVEEKMTTFKEEFDKKQDDERFEAFTSKFMSETPDFEQFRDQIADWLKKHDSITDVSVAYHAVKGELTVKEAKEKAEAEAAEAAKNVLLNASGGGSFAQTTADGKRLVDILIADRSNANRF